MFVLRFIKEAFGITSIAFIIFAAFLFLFGSGFYLVGLPAQWGILPAFVAMGFGGKFIDSKLHISTSPIAEVPIPFKKAAVAIILGLNWTVVMVLMVKHQESQSKSSLPVFLVGLVVLFLIFGFLERVWNRELHLRQRRFGSKVAASRPVTERLSNRKTI